MKKFLAGVLAISSLSLSIFNSGAFASNAAAPTSENAPKQFEVVSETSSLDNEEIKAPENADEAKIRLDALINNTPSLPLKSEQGLLIQPYVYGPKVGYVQAKQYAQGGRVDIDFRNYYMRPDEARAFATKMEVSWAESAIWFASSFFSGGAGAVFGTVGFLEMSYRTAIVSQVRQLADANKCVLVTIAMDNFYGFSSTGVSQWNGLLEPIQTAYSNTPYTTVVSRTYSY